MKNLVLEKLCLNICVGESGDNLTRAAKVLESLTGTCQITVVLYIKYLKVNNLSFPRLAIPSVRSVSLYRYPKKNADSQVFVETKRFPFTAPSVVPRPKKSWVLYFHIYILYLLTR